jgi:hypothetical protein
MSVRLPARLELADIVESFRDVERQLQANGHENHRGYRVSNIGSAVAPADAVTLDQLQQEARKLLLQIEQLRRSGLDATRRDDLLDATKVAKAGDTMTGSLRASALTAKFYATGMSGTTYVWGTPIFNTDIGIFSRQNSNTEIRVAEAGYYAIRINSSQIWDATSYGNIILTRYTSTAAVAETVPKYAANRAALNAGISNAWSEAFLCAAGDYFTLSVAVGVGSVSSYDVNSTHFSLTKEN